jgi:predicted metal-dependent HD superfamily phosphohydrolase
LAILGSKNSKYIAYTEKIRKEYLIYEDALYKQGRRAVLKSFLTKERIYHSDFFYHKYEKQAQENILKEYNSLLI